MMQVHEKAMNFTRAVNVRPEGKMFVEAEVLTSTGSENDGYILVMQPQVRPLRGEDYPSLVSLWDNDDDAIYDQF